MDESTSSTPSTEAPPPRHRSTRAELERKAECYDRLEALPVGSEITIDQHPQDSAKKRFKIKEKTAGAGATYLEGDSIATAFYPPEQA